MKDSLAVSRDLSPVLTDEAISRESIYSAPG